MNGGGRKGGGSYDIPGGEKHTSRMRELDPKVKGDGSTNALMRD